MFWRPLRITVINKNSLTSRIITRLDVPPSIADHKAVGDIDVVPARRFQKHSGHGLAAITFVLIRVAADENIVEWKLCAQSLVHLLQHLAG